jgi:hypothetical protein
MAQSISHEILQAALAGLKLQEQHIQNQIAEVESMLGGTSNASAIKTSETQPSTRVKRRQFSAATKKRMAEAQRQRWAKLKGESAPVSEPEPAPKKRRMSKEGRAAIVAAVRKRWAEKRAAEGTKPATTEKTASKRTAVRKTSARVKKAAPVKKVAAKRGRAKAASVAAPTATPANV